MPFRVGSGIPNLDGLLGGGLLQGGLHLVAGDPGTGKTVMAHQIASAVAREGKALYLTFLVELHETLRIQAGGFRFFDPASVGESLYYLSIYPAFAKEGFQGVEEQIRSQLATHDADLLVLDGLHVLKDAAHERARYNRFIASLQAYAASTGTTSILVSNRNPGEPADAMYTICDAVLLMESHAHGPARPLRLEIRKMRTSEHAQGKHAYEITESGVELHPRPEAMVADSGAETAEIPAEDELHGFRVEGLNDMLGGGVGRASATLVAGATGTGKTSLGLAYLADGFQRGEAGVFLGFHETPGRILAKGESVGLPVTDAFAGDRGRALWHSSAETPSDRLAHRLMAAVRELEAARVVIDGVDDLVRPLEQEERRISFLNALLALLRSRGVGVLLTMELPDVFKLDVSLPMAEVSTSADNILLLRRVESRSELGRVLSVLKVRDRDAESDARKLIIGPDGLRVGDRFAAAERLRHRDEDPS